MLIINIFSISCSQNSTPDISYPRYNFSYCSGVKNDYQSYGYYTDDFFTTSASELNISFATTSLNLAMAGFASNRNSGKLDYSKRYRNAENYLKDLGFTNFDVNSYYKQKPWQDSFGAAFGSKKIHNNVTLIACSLRGANYETEWAGNFTIGSGEDGITYHKGFYDASTILINSLKDYIDNYEITGNIKIWSAGYSRAGATNNLFAGRLNLSLQNNEHLLGENVSFTREDIYAFCFEPPAGVYYTQGEKIRERGSDFDNIKCFVNHNDPVPKVLTKEMGFTRFGKDYYFADRRNTLNYSSAANKFKNQLNSFSQVEGYLVDNFLMKKFEGFKLGINATNYQNWTEGNFLDDFLRYLSTIIGNRTFFYERLQPGLRNLFTVLYENGSPKDSLMEVGIRAGLNIIVSDPDNLLFDDIVHARDKFFKDLAPMLKNSLKSLGIDDFNIDNFIGSLEQIVYAIVEVFAFDPELIISLISKNNIKAIGQAHLPELCLSHMRASDPNFESSPNKLYESFYMAKGENVLNFELNNKGNNLIKIENGELKNYNCTLPLKYENHSLTIYFPSDESYHISSSYDGDGYLNLGKFNQEYNESISFATLDEKTSAINF